MKIKFIDALILDLVIVYIFYLFPMAILVINYIKLQYFILNLL